jgi:hypothetical protein
VNTQIPATINPTRELRSGRLGAGCRGENEPGSCIPFGPAAHTWPGCDACAIGGGKAADGAACSHCLCCAGALTPALTGVPQRGQFPSVRDGESGNPQAAHFIRSILSSRINPHLPSLITVTYQRLCGKLFLAEWATSVREDNLELQTNTDILTRILKNLCYYDNIGAII